MSYLWFIFCNGNILIKKQQDGTFTVPDGEECPLGVIPDGDILDITPMADGTPVKATTTAEMPQNIPGCEMCGLRPSFYKLPHDLYMKAGKCEELLYWNKGTQYCGTCGAPMVFSTDISKRCTKCGKEIWPQLSTAIIVLISRGDDVLLVHANNFRGNFYGLVAGFVETGETLEEAVVREVREETSLTIKNLRYYASQPWPYPCGLMVGFYAEYESGEVKLQRSELGAGGWFNKDSLPTIPEKLSLARMLIDHWLEEKNNTETRK